MRKDIRYLPYGMILTPFFQKAKIKINEEMQVILPNATTMITISNLHKMQLTLGDDKHWIRARTTPLPPTFPLSIVGKGTTTTHASAGAPGDTTIAQSHVLLLEVMCKLHVHIIDKLFTHSEHIETISIGLFAFKADMERDLTTFHDRF